MKRGLLWYSLLAVAIGLALAVVEVFLGRGSFIHFVLVIGVCIYIGGPLLLFSVIYFSLLRGRLGKELSKIATSALLGVVVVLLQLISLPLGGAVYRADVREAQELCESLVPLIDKYMEAHGSYPDSIDAFIDKGKPLPRLLTRSGKFYLGGEDGFSFNFIDPAGLMSMYCYSSEGRKWFKFD